MRWRSQQGVNTNTALEKLRSGEHFSPEYVQLTSTRTSLRTRTPLCSIREKMRTSLSRVPVARGQPEEGTDSSGTWQYMDTDLRASSLSVSSERQMITSGSRPLRRARDDREWRHQPAKYLRRTTVPARLRKCVAWPREAASR